MKIALISCSKSKQSYECEAYKLYIPSELFRCSYEYAKTFADKIYILSAKYGLLDESEIIKPYDVSLNDMSEQEKIDWSQKIVRQLKCCSDIKNDEYFIFAGKNYYNYIISELKYSRLPLGNRALGERIHFLKELLGHAKKESDSSSISALNKVNSKSTVMSIELHQYFNEQKRYDFNTIQEIPFENGIYIMFEAGEKYGEYDRIVRIGTHDSQNRLKNRLRDHFLKKNKDGSIFRKNNGRALLAKDNNGYLDIWNLDTSKNDNRKYIQSDIQIKIENEVTSYLQNRITFTCIQVDDAKQRLRLEKAMIAILNQDPEFGPSKNWLGNYSKENEISNSGIWLKIGIDHQPLNDKELDFILKNRTGQPYVLKHENIEAITPRDINKPDIETIWKNIIEHEGSVFLTKTNMELVYHVDGNMLKHNRTSTPLSKADIEKALLRLPLSGPRDINTVVTGPAYIYAILSDKRIVNEE